MARLGSAVVEAVGSDLVALAQAHALDATTFPHPSMPPIFGGDAPPSVWIARAEHRGPVVGFVATHSRRGALTILGLAVEAAHRRSGLGHELVRTAVRSARARGLTRVELCVSTGNESALALYLSEGFRKERLLLRYYSATRFPDDGDAWAMVRDLL